MSLPSPAMVKEVNTKLMTIMNTKVYDPVGMGAQAMANIRKELSQPLECLVAYKRIDVKEDPIYRKLYEWMIYPQRTAEELIYVVGPLARNEETESMLYVGVAALEALALKCPVLGGPWEILVLLILQTMEFRYDGFRPSDRLKAWIIHMIGDADICPNPYLRIELMYLMKVVGIDELNRIQTLEAVMDACSNLNYDFLSRNYYISRNYERVSFDTIIEIIKRLEVDLSEFGETLAKKLKEVNTSRLSNMVYDSTYRYAKNPNSYSNPRELTSLVALLNTTAENARHKFKHFESSQYGFNIDNIVYMFEVLIQKFLSCHQMPQLTFPTSSFVIEVIELVIRNEIKRIATYNPRFEPIRKDDLIKMDRQLHDLFTDNGSSNVDDSLIVRVLVKQYVIRLKILKELFGNFDPYPTICRVMNHI